jgi:hypothetical protein
VISGEQLEATVVTPLPDKIVRPLSKDEAKARFAKMRDELGL